MSTTSKSGPSGWTAPRLVWVGLSALVALEVLEGLTRQRRRTALAMSTWWSDVQLDQLRAFRRAEIGELARVVSSAAARARR